MAVVTRGDGFGLVAQSVAARFCLVCAAPDDGEGIGHSFLFFFTGQALCRTAIEPAGSDP